MAVGNTVAETNRGEGKRTVPEWKVWQQLRPASADMMEAFQRGMLPVYKLHTWIEVYIPYALSTRAPTTLSCSRGYNGNV